MRIRSSKKNIRDARLSEDYTGRARPRNVVGRTVLEVTYNCGSYGMGGHGFFGLKLTATQERAEEWLVCTLSSASEWIIVNGRWLTAFGQPHVQRPWMNWGRDEKSGLPDDAKCWDEFMTLVEGQAIQNFRCRKHWCELVIGDAVLQITEDHSTRPLFLGNGKPRQLTVQDDLRRAWVFAKDTYLLC